VYNGYKTVVVVAVVVVAQSTRFNSCAVDNVHSESRHPSAVAELLVLRAGRITPVLGDHSSGAARGREGGSFPPTGGRPKIMYCVCALQ